MEKDLKILAKNERKCIYAPASAKKHNCSESYVRSVVAGDRESNSKLAQMILRDANDIVAVYDRNTKEFLLA